MLWLEVEPSANLHIVWIQLCLHFNRESNLVASCIIQSAEILNILTYVLIGNRTWYPVAFQIIMQHTVTVYTSECHYTFIMWCSAIIDSKLAGQLLKLFENVWYCLYHIYSNIAKLLAGFCWNQYGNLIATHFSVPLLCKSEFRVDQSASLQCFSDLFLIWNFVISFKLAPHI